MAKLKYKTRGNSTPQGKPRVYFCCHRSDFEKYFEEISNEVLTKQDCAIWFADEAVEYNEDLFLDLKQMQLFIMPVTTNLLCTENGALNIEFRFAVDNHIPVLPLMQENGLIELFNEKCGELQFLDKNNTDITAISYDEKLEKYLSSVLIGDELAEKIRAAFDAYVFLSYRKKDRKYAQELMRLIHKNDFCRDIAIWYDEFLTPGENFNDSIKDALQKSELFVLTVTPNLVNEINYIMTTEYPMARQDGKPILPAELVPTDREKLFEQYADIPTPTDAHNEAELSDALLESIKKIAVKENDNSPEHNFFIGLAYLSGIDVEVDHEKAVHLITYAAENGVLEAMDKLIFMYETGVGVGCDYSKVVYWQKKLFEKIKEGMNIETSVNAEVKRYGALAFDLSSNLNCMGHKKEALSYAKEYYEFLEQYILLHFKNDCIEMARLYDEMSNFYRNAEFIDIFCTNAESKKSKSYIYVQKAFSMFFEYTWDFNRKNIGLFVDVTNNLVRLCDNKNSLEIYEKIKNTVKSIENHYFESNSMLDEDAVYILHNLYECCAETCRGNNDYSGAEGFYLKSYSLLSRALNLRDTIDKTLYKNLICSLSCLRRLKRLEGNEEECSKYAYKIITLQLQYIKAVENSESLDTDRRVAVICQEYSEVAHLYESIGDDVNANYYFKKMCQYGEKITQLHFTPDNIARLIHLYEDYKSFFSFKHQLSQQSLVERKEIDRKIIKYLHELLNFYENDDIQLYELGKLRDILLDLSKCYVDIGEENQAINYCKKYYDVSMQYYGKTKFIRNAYQASYEMAEIYKKFAKYDKSCEYFIMGLKYEERMLKDSIAREDRERLAWLYNKAGNYNILAGKYADGYEYYKIAYRIYDNVYEKYKDFDSAKHLYYTMRNMLEHTNKADESTVNCLKERTYKLKEEWHII